MPEEYLDLVNEDDQVVGNMSRKEVYKKELHNYRVVYLILRNSEGKIWIPRRTQNTSILPLHLDLSMCGHVSSGETYEQACVRETEEELNIELKPGEYRELARLSPHKDNAFCFMSVFETQSDEEPSYNPKDFVEARWMSIDEILNLPNTDEKYKDDMILILKKVYQVE